MFDLKSWCSLADDDVLASSDDDCKGSSNIARDASSENCPTNSRGALQDHPSALRQAKDDRDGNSRGDEAGSPENESLCFEVEEENADTEGNAQEQWQRTDAYMRDVQQAFRSRPAIRLQGNDRYLKLLLVGEPGLGKELFVKNAFAAYCEDNDLPVSSCPPETSAAAFLKAPAEFCTDIIIELDGGQSRIHFVVQDTPGTHITGAEASIMKHILKQNRDYMAKEEDPKRVVPLSSLPDPRVDVVLFFISPYYLKPQDVQFMTRLSSVVPVIPIVAKADSLTTKELDEYRKLVRGKLEEAGARVGKPVMHSFSSQDLEQAGAARAVPPFAIITSREVDHEVGSHWFTRQFPWGKCEVMSSNHSDLPALKSLLFEHCFESFKAGTEARFYTARESFLTSRALSRALSSGELPPETKTRSEPASLSTSPFAKKGSRTANTNYPSPPPRPPQPQPVPMRSLVPKPERRVWSWSLGLTIGVLSLAIAGQIVAYRCYSRNVSQLEAIILQYRQESMTEKQVLADMLRELGEL